MKEPTIFQQRSIDYIYDTLFESEKGDRFLLADEVGLGKTITAAGVLKKYYESKSSSGNDVTVGYICNNAALASKNINELLVFLGQNNQTSGAKQKITVNNDINQAIRNRLTLAFLNKIDINEKCKIRALTPRTTLNVDSKGTKEEFAAAFAICFGRVTKKNQCLYNILSEVTEKKDCMDMINVFRDYFKKETYLETSLIKLKKNIKRECRKYVQEKLLPDLYKHIACADYKIITCSLAIMLKLCDEDIDVGNQPSTIKKKLNGTKFEINGYESDTKEIKNFWPILNINKLTYTDKIIEKAKNDVIKNYKDFNSRIIEVAHLIAKEDNIVNTYVSAIIDKYVALKDILPKSQNNGQLDAKQKEKIDKIYLQCIKPHLAELFKIARRNMIKASIGKDHIDFYIADEIQNYSELFRQAKVNTESENNIVINEVLHSDKKLLLLSATPFRVATKYNKLEDLEQDHADADTNIHLSYAINTPEREYIDNASLQQEFKLIINYLNSDFEWDKWDELCEEKLDALKKTDNQRFKDIVKQQSEMLVKQAHISRFERYMSGLDTDPLICKDDIEWKDMPLEEIGAMPHVTSSIQEKSFEEILDDEDFPEIYMFSYENEVYFIYDNIIYKADEDQQQHYSSVPFERYILTLPDDNDIEPIYEDDELNAYIDQKINENVCGSIRLNYIKETPALFSFCGEDYKELKNKVDESNKFVISHQRLNEHQPLVYTNGIKDTDGILYNSRLSKLFENLFDKEEQHLLLFIPPSQPCELKGVFKGKRGISKRLFFTYQKMTPKSLSALISYESDRRVRSELEEYKAIFPELKISCEGKKIGWEQLESDNIIDISTITKLAHRDENNNNPCSPSVYMKELNCKKDFTDIFFRIICSKDEAVRVMVLARLRALNQTNNECELDFYNDIIMPYLSDGRIDLVFDEYIYATGTTKSDFARDIKNLANHRFSGIEAKCDDGEKEIMKTYFAQGHYSDRVEDGGALENKINIFNSPFRPFCLISTSIGQEGFNFHLYCRKVVHWALECNPLKFEQREGRVNRYHSYSTRLNISEKFNENSAWDDMFKYYRNNPSNEDHYGLYPDFIFDKGKFPIERERYYYPDSFEMLIFDDILQAVGYYRSLLGQFSDESHEEKLQALIASDDPNEKTKYFINLMPPPSKVD